MRTRLQTQLLAIARREAGPMLAEDVVQDSLLVAIEQDRHDVADPANAAWLRGVVRNKARMAARSGRRRHSRESAWQAARQEDEMAEPGNLPALLSGLPPALRALAALTLSGHSRREIAWLLNLNDAALRQRIKGLKRHLVQMGLAKPQDLPGLTLDLAYGRIRAALLPQLLRQGGVFASHDPDGHLFVVRLSQKPVARQQET